MKKRLFVLGTALVLCLSLCACSKAGHSDAVFPNEKYESGSAIMEDSSVKLDGDVTVTERKIIQTISMTVQTKSYDSLIADIEAQVSTLEGYIESSEAGGVDGGQSNRYTRIVVRIPQKNTDSFTGYVAQNCTVISKNVSTEDATLEYVDIESRISALQAEKTALEGLLTKAGSVAEIISVQERLTEVIYQLESYQSQLRTLENLVSYSTVSIYVREVERITVVEEQSVWQEIGTNLKNNTEDIGRFLKNAFVFLISAIPYLILISVIPAIVLIIVFTSIKRRRKRNQKTDK